VISGPRREECGFALALVVLLLFAVGVLGTTGYQIAVLSSDLAVQGKEGQRAHSIARAGLQLYMATQMGLPADTMTYSLEGGDAVVTSRFMAQISDTISLYLVKSEGIYLDPISASSAARRTLFQFAEHREVPLDFEAALVMASGDLDVKSNGTVDGNDQASSGDCSQNGFDTGGVLLGSGSASYNGSDLDGSPVEASVGSFQAVLDSLGLTWDVFNDANFTPDYEDRWPPSLYYDSFKVTRFTGSKSARWNNSGSGLLIVQGDLKPKQGFFWRGIIMAGRVKPKTKGSSWKQTYTLEGVVVAGLDNAGDKLKVTRYATIEFNRCYAYQAGSKVAYFRPVKNSWWEGS
jgi:hypothetical protein